MPQSVSHYPVGTLSVQGHEALFQRNEHKLNAVQFFREWNHARQTQTSRVIRNTQQVILDPIGRPEPLIPFELKSGHAGAAGTISSAQTHIETMVQQQPHQGPAVGGRFDFTNNAGFIGYFDLYHHYSTSGLII
jgi:hypothetical protein